MKIVMPYNLDKYVPEIDALLRSYYSDYETRIYLKPVYYVDGIKSEPERYPLLAGLPVKFQKRYISLFLKAQGRIARNGNQTNARIWMLAGVKE